MGNRKGFEWKGKSGASAAHVTKKFTAPMSGLEDAYFTWGTVGGAARYTKIVDNLRVCCNIFLQSRYGSREGNGRSKSSCLCKEGASCVHVLVQHKLGGRGLEKKRKRSVILTLRQIMVPCSRTESISLRSTSTVSGKNTQ